MNLRKTFSGLCAAYTHNEVQINFCLEEIATAYSEKNRHYHNLSHLENLYAQLLELKGRINNWDAVLFALFYHDAVYNTLKQNNEEKSAELAEVRLKSIQVPEEIISIVVQHILATKSHQVSNNNDTNLFTDADLSILGASWEIYERYAAQIRKEYSIYPDLMYNPGRRKVLQHFLAMPEIFKTKYFRERFEKQARVNLQQEIDLL